MMMEDNYKPDLEIGKDETSRVAEEVTKDFQELREKYIRDHKVDITDDDVTMFKRPRKGCHHCYGTGVVGAYDRNSKRMPGQLCLCNCLSNHFGIESPDGTDTNKYLTYGDFRKMLKAGRLRFNLEEPNEPDSKTDAASTEGADQESSEGRDQSSAESNSRQDISESVVSEHAG
jgi:hypothetical protein